MPNSTNSRLPLLSAFLIVAALIPSTLVSSLVEQDDKQIPQEIFQRGQLKRSRLTFNDRVLLGKAVANKDERVTVLIAAFEGRTQAAANAFERLGGKTRVRLDDLAYIRGTISPLVVPALIREEDVQDLQLDGNLQTLRDWETAADNWQKYRPVLPEYPRRPTRNLPLLTADAFTALNPYVPTMDIGAPQFMKAHPTFDGRGITIAIIEGLPDLLHPVLQFPAKRLDGTPTRKVAAVITSDEISGDNPKQEIEISEDLNVTTSGSFLVHGDPYFTETRGRCRFLRFKDFHHDVLWNIEEKRVWVDTNDDHRFRNKNSIRDFNVTGDVLAVQFDKSKYFTPVVVTIDDQRDMLSVYEGSVSHATAVASVASGSHFLGGEASGVAPATQLVFTMVAGSKPHDIIESFVRAARDKRVDVMTDQLGVDANWDGETVFPLVMDRIVRVYKKPIFVSAGNAGLFQAVTPHAAMPNVLAIGGARSKETIERFEGIVVEPAFSVGSVSDRGPGPLGTLKPDFVAPDEYVTPYRCSQDDEELRRRSLAVNNVPDCYASGEGTSFSAPTAAGAAALLISAARQRGIAVEAGDIAWALRESAQFLPGYNATDQGSGMIQVGRAWDLLQATASHPRTELFCAGPVIGRQQKQESKTPGVGYSLYETEGWMSDMRRIRTIHLYRSNGSVEPLPVTLSMVGNDGTYEVAKTTTLPLRKPVSVSVSINVVSPGVHAALLKVRDKTTGLPIATFPLTVVAANTLTKDSNFTTSVPFEVGTDKPQFVFIDVPPKASAISIDLTVRSGVIRLKHSIGVLRGYEVSDSFPYEFPLERWAFHAGHYSETLPVHFSGLWSFSISSGGDNLRSVGEPSRGIGTLSVSLLGGELRRNSSQGRDEVAIESPYAVDPHATLTVSVAASRSQNVLLNGADLPKVQEFKVDGGTEQLLVDVHLNLVPDPSLVRIRNALFALYDCHEERCKLWSLRDENETSERAAQFLVAHPFPGRWKLIVFGDSDSTSAVIHEMEISGAYGPAEELNCKTSDSGTMVTCPFSPQISAIPTDGRGLDQVFLFRTFAPHGNSVTPMYFTDSYNPEDGIDRVPLAVNFWPLDSESIRPLLGDWPSMKPTGSKSVDLPQ